MSGSPAEDVLDDRQPIAEPGDRSALFVAETPIFTASRDDGRFAFAGFVV